MTFKRSFGWSCFAVAWVVGCGGAASDRRADDDEDAPEDEVTDEEDADGDDDEADGVGGAGGVPPPPAVGAEFECRSKTQDPGPALVRRLTVREYVNAVQDALGVDVASLAANLPTDVAQDGFTNDANAQTVVLDHVQTWASVAGSAVGKLPDKAAFVAKHATCRELTDACFNGFVDKLGLRLMRRPLDAAERSSFAPILATIKADGGTFDEAALLVTEAMLQSPRFLYRIEVQRSADGKGGVRTVDGYELASRLSFLFWSSGPDDALLESARTGKLDGDGLGAEVDRLLASDKARRSGQAYVNGWLHFQRLKDLATPLASDMRAETEAVFDEVVWTQKKPLTSLFDAPFTVASKALATHYKLPAPKDGTSRYDLASGQRKGILTHASVLSAGGEDSSLVLRGLFLLQNVLCSSVPPPPVGVNNGRPDTEPGKPQRWYAEQRMKTEPCSNCHKHIDPLAFAFEVFTGLGELRDKDSGGNALDTSGTLVTPYDESGRAFDDPASFIGLVAGDERVRDCMVLKPVQYALGRALSETDACTLKGVRDAVTDDGVTFQNVLKNLALQPSFRLARIEN